MNLREKKLPGNNFSYKKYKKNIQILCMKHMRKCYTEHIQNEYEICMFRSYFVYILYMFRVSFSYMILT